jgi:hypothetical protein
MWSWWERKCTSDNMMGRFGHHISMYFKLGDEVNMRITHLESYESQITTWLGILEILFGCKCRRGMRWAQKEHISFPSRSETDVYESWYLPNGGLHYIRNKFGMFVYHVWLHLGATFCVAKWSIVQKSLQSLRQKGFTLN